MERIKDLLVSLIFILFDVLIILAIFIFSLWLSSILSPWLGIELDFPLAEKMMLIGTLILITIFLMLNLYPGYGLTAVKELQQTSQAILAMSIILLGISFLTNSNSCNFQYVLLINFILNISVLPLAHLILRNFLSRLAFYGTAIHIFGKQKDASVIEKTLNNVRRLGWRVKAVYPLAYINKLNEIQPGSTIALLAVDSLKKASEFEHNLSHKYSKVVVVPQNDKLGSLWVVPRDLGGDLGLEFRYNLLAWHSIVIKQCFDYIFSMLGLVLLSPMLIIAAILVKLDSPGPIIFKQIRMGKYSRPFRHYKFRTMYENADEILADLLSSDEAIYKEYKKFHKIRNDPRITRVGKWLRRYSIDEFPQLLNVLSGEMSLSGPRAYLPSEKEEMGDYVKIIHRVKPGISGWWQVLGRNNVAFTNRLEMDKYYISNWSLSMDIYIYLKTIVVILVGKGL